MKETANGVPAILPEHIPQFSRIFIFCLQYFMKRSSKKFFKPKIKIQHNMNI